MRILVARVRVAQFVLHQTSCYYNGNFYEEFEACLYQILTKEISVSL